MQYFLRRQRSVEVIQRNYRMYRLRRLLAAFSLVLIDGRLNSDALFVVAREVYS